MNGGSESSKRAVHGMPCPYGKHGWLGPVKGANAALKAAALHLNLDPSRRTGNSDVARRMLADPAGIGAGLARFVGEIVQLLFKTRLPIFQVFQVGVAVVNDDHALRQAGVGIEGHAALFGDFGFRLRDLLIDGRNLILYLCGPAAPGLFVAATG